jgi:hypothetical protein
MKMKKYTPPKMEVYSVFVEESIANTSNITIQQSADQGWLEVWQEEEIDLQYEFQK